MLGSQGAILKRKPWEESICVPGIMRHPGKVSAGRKTDALLSHVDLGPTLLSLCQIPIPGHMQGTDLSDVVLGKKEAGPDSAYFQIFGPYHGDGTPRAWRGVRTDRYMYARGESEPWVLYNLEEDPYEMKNLATDSSASSIRKEMDERLADWMKRVGDSWGLDWVEPVEDSGSLFSYRTFYTVDEYRKWAKANPNLNPGI
jgi:arylsulfatase A-like enzyme